MNPKFYGIAAACLLAGTLLAYLSNAEDSTSEAKVSPKAAATSTTLSSNAADRAKASQAARSEPRPVPKLTAPPKAHQAPEPVYKRPADAPESWSDFQAAIYAYKDTVLGPEIRTCWHTVGGNGRLVATHNYVVTGGIARPRMISLEPDAEPVPDITIRKADAALSTEDLETALACLRTAAAGTEFHFVGLNGETDLDDTFMGNWAWRTPASLEERARLTRSSGEPSEQR